MEAATGPFKENGERICILGSIRYRVGVVGSVGIVRRRDTPETIR